MKGILTLFIILIAIIIILAIIRIILLLGPIFILAIIFVVGYYLIRKYDIHIFPNKNPGKITQVTTKEQEKSDLNPPNKSSIDKGAQFEEYVISQFNPKYFSVVEKTHKFTEPNDRFIESNLNPDFVLRYIPKNEIFAVECKYRSNLSEKGSLIWSNDSQLARYNDFITSRNIPVFVILGYSGTPSKPYKLYIIPLKDGIGIELPAHAFWRYEKAVNVPFYWNNNQLS